MAILMVMTIVTTIVALFWIPGAAVLKDWFDLVVGFVILIGPLALIWAIWRSGKDVNAGAPKGYQSG